MHFHKTKRFRYKNKISHIIIYYLIYFSDDTLMETDQNVFLYGGKFLLIRIDNLFQYFGDRPFGIGERFCGLLLITLCIA